MDHNIQTLRRALLVDNYDVQDFQDNAFLDVLINKVVVSTNFLKPPWSLIGFTWTSPCRPVVFIGIKLSTIIWSYSFVFFICSVLNYN